MKLIFKLLKHLLFGYQKEKLNKDATFLSSKDTNILLNPNNSGLLLDGYKSRLSQKKSFEHLAIIARTGA
jgi:type IV secretion system protein VirD4